MFFGRRQLAGVFLAILALAVAIAGCGGGGDSSGPLTQAEYAAQANQICAKEAKKLEGEVEAYADKRNLRYRTAPPVKVFEEEAEEIFVPSLERKIAQLQELEPPAKDEEQIAKMLSEAEKGLQEGKVKPAVLISGQALGEARKLATENGLKECF